MLKLFGLKWVIREIKKEEGQTMELYASRYVRSCGFITALFVGMFTFCTICFADWIEILPLSRPEEIKSLPFSSVKIMIDDKNLSMIVQYKDLLPAPGTVIGKENEAKTLDSSFISLDIDNNPDTPGVFNGFEREVQILKNASARLQNEEWTQVVHYSIDVKEWDKNKFGESIFKAKESRNPENISIAGQTMTIKIPIQYVTLKSGDKIRVSFMGADSKKIMNSITIP